MPHCSRSLPPINIAVLGLVLAAFSGCSKPAPRVCPEGLEKDNARSIDKKELMCRSADGKKVRWNDYHPNGQRRQLCGFNNGKAEGTFLAWYPNGKQWLEGVFKEGNKVGKWTQWGATGAVVAKGEYRDGQFIAGAPVGVAAICDQVKP